MGGELEVGQDAGIDQALIEHLVQGVQPLHHVAIEQRVENHLDAQRQRLRRQRVMEGLGQGLRAKGVAVFTELLAVVEQRQALLQGK